jgi:ArsR family transcriptional regulator, lead/cadmium/zinc/bismuth-responsive transcriptional repressor
MRANVEEVTAASDLCNVPCFKEGLVRRIQRELPDDEHLADAVSLFSALSDRARLKIILALGRGEELCVCDVAHVLKLSVSTASHHLRKLRDLRVLKYRNDGKMAYYSLRDQEAAKLVEDAIEKVEAG